jgi:hypothetical protein
LAADDQHAIAVGLLAFAWAGGIRCIERLRRCRKGVDRVVELVEIGDAAASIVGDDDV